MMVSLSSSIIVSITLERIILMVKIFFEKKNNWYVDINTELVVVSQLYFQPVEGAQTCHNAELHFARFAYIYFSVFVEK